MHEYLRRLLVATRKDLLPQVAEVHVDHDEWCPFVLKTGECNCDPVMSFDDQGTKRHIFKDGSVL